MTVIKWIADHASLILFVGAVTLGTIFVASGSILALVTGAITTILTVLCMRGSTSPCVIGAN